MKLLAYALRPLQPVGLIFVALFTAMGWLAMKAGLIGLPLGLLVISWFFKYAYVVLESTAHGRPLPVMSIEMVNPVEQRPMAQLLLFGIAWAPMWFWGGPGGLITSLALSALLPATMAILGAGDRAIDAVNPASIARVIRGLGWDYLPISILLFFQCVLFYALARAGFGAGLLWAVAQLCTLSAFSLLGGAIFERREALGFDAELAPERTSERDARERERARNQILDEMHVPKRIRELDRLADPLVPWLESARGPDLAEDARAIHLRVSAWEDPAALGVITRALVSRLVADRQDSLALSLLIATRRQLPALRPARDEDTRRLAGHARATGQSRLAEQLEREMIGG